MNREKKWKGAITHSCICCLRYVTLVTDSVIEYHSLKLDMIPEME